MWRKIAVLWGVASGSVWFWLAVVGVMFWFAGRVGISEKEMDYLKNRKGGFELCVERGNAYFAEHPDYVIPDRTADSMVRRGCSRSWDWF